MSKKDGYLTRQDKKDLVRALKKAQRHVRFTRMLFKAAEGPHDSPFSGERNVLESVEDHLEQLSKAIKEIVPYVSPILPR